MNCANGCGASVRRTRPGDGIDPRDYEWVHVFPMSDGSELANPICDLTPVATPEQPPAAGPVFGAIDEQGQLAGYTGFELWMTAVWLPVGREGEAVAALASHGLVVYRMWRPGGVTGG